MPGASGSARSFTEDEDRREYRQTADARRDRCMRAFRRLIDLGRFRGHTDVGVPSGHSVRMVTSRRADAARRCQCVQRLPVTSPDTIWM